MKVGFAPAFSNADEALGFIMKAIEGAGYKPGLDVLLALDPASTEFFQDGKYILAGEGKTFDAADLVALLRGSCRSLSHFVDRGWKWRKTIGRVGQH